MQTANDRFVQLITCTHEIMIAYTSFDNRLLIFSKKFRSWRQVRLPI